MFIKTSQIQLNSIDFDVNWNLHPWALDSLPESLEQSLIVSGILHPPVLLPTDEAGDRFEIVSGFRRISFIKQHKALSPATSVDCRILAPETSPERIMSLVLEEQLYSGTVLSLAEKGRFIQIAKNYFPQNEILEKFGGRLQLKNSRELLQNLEVLLTGHQTLIEEIHHGRLQEKLLSEILRLPTENDQFSIIALFKTLHLGGGKQRRLFSLLRDAAYRIPTSISEYLKDDLVLEIVDHDQLNPPQKFQHLSNFLNQQIHPASLTAEKEFLEQVRAMNLPEDYSLQHTTAFEKDQVTLSILFENIRECQMYLKGKSKN
jgi:hypothetical protein